MKPIARAVLTVIFVGLLATPLLIRRYYAAPAPPPGGGNADSLSRYGFRFTESAKGAGASAKRSRSSSPAFMMTYRSSTAASSVRTSPNRV